MSYKINTLNNKIIKYLFSNTISNGIKFFSRWLVNYGLARFMSLSDFGIFSFISSLVNLFNSILSFGGQLFLIYKVSKEKERKYYHYLKSAFLSVIIAFGLGSVFLCLSIFNQTIINTNNHRNNKESKIWIYIDNKEVVERMKSGNAKRNAGN